MIILCSSSAFLAKNSVWTLISKIIWEDHWGWSFVVWLRQNLMRDCCCMTRHWWLRVPEWVLAVVWSEKQREIFLATSRMMSSTTSISAMLYATLVLPNFDAFLLRWTRTFQTHYIHALGIMWSLVGYTRSCLRARYPCVCSWLLDSLSNFFSTCFGLHWHWICFSVQGLQLNKLHSCRIE